MRKKVFFLLFSISTVVIAEYSLCQYRIANGETVGQALLPETKNIKETKTQKENSHPPKHITSSFGPSEE